MMMMSDQQGRDGFKPIEWVKEYRLRTGCGLREAFDAFQAGRSMPNLDDKEKIRTEQSFHDEIERYQRFVPSSAGVFRLLNKTAVVGWKS